MMGGDDACRPCSVLRRYRQALAGQANALGWLTASSGRLLLRLDVFGMALSAWASRWQNRDGAAAWLALSDRSRVSSSSRGAAPVTPWKARHLTCCGNARARRTLPADAGSAWRHGLRLGLQLRPLLVPVLMAIPWSSGSWTFARWLSSGSLTG